MLAGLLSTSVLGGRCGVVLRAVSSALGAASDGEVGACSLGGLAHDPAEGAVPDGSVLASRRAKVPGGRGSAVGACSRWEWGSAAGAEVFASGVLVVVVHWFAPWVVAAWMGIFHCPFVSGVEGGSPRRRGGARNPRFSGGVLRGFRSVLRGRSGGFRLGVCG